MGTAGADDVAAAHARVVADKTLQFDFTAFQPKTPPKDPAWLEAVGRFLDAVGPAMRVVFWIGLAAIVGVIAFVIVREVARTRWPDRFGRRRPKDLPSDGWRPTAAEALALLEDADRLADAGRYEEAAHLLLHRSIQDIQGRRPHLVKPALTARDIAGLEGLPARARPAFAGIAEAVERSFFGGRPIGREGWLDCRQAYEAFAFPEVWS